MTKPGRKFTCSLAALVWLAAASASIDAQEDRPASDTLARREWVVDDANREALIHASAGAKTQPSPVVFAFHGHGGTMRNAARTFRYHEHWPAAIVVYMQGLNTPGRLTDPEGKKPGWQHALGAQADRDLKFFDAVLASLQREYQVDARRIYSTGHSNGGGFTYLLWAARSDVLAAVAPSSAVAAQALSDLKPKPVLHVAGEQDPLVKYEWQQRTLEALRKLNGCEANGVIQQPGYTLYPSQTGTPVVTLIHPGDHKFLAEAPPIIVKFFQGQAKP